MKMKSVFVSMLAIAALASCSRQEFIDPPGPKPEGKERLVELTINGTSLSSKAGTVGTPADNDVDKAITNITVFGVNAASGAVITKKYFGTVTAEGDAGAKKVVFATTDQTTDIYAIANIGSDLTPTTLNVNTVWQLKNASGSLLVPVTNVPKQTQGDVLMSGHTPSITPAADGNNATASVTLEFIAAKIILKSLKRATGAEGAYGTDYKFKNVIMSHVQTAAYYVMDNNSYIGEIVDPERPAIGVTWATGMANVAGETTVADFKQAIPATVTEFTDAKPIEDIAYWYVFENPNTNKDKLTTLLIEYDWKKNSAEADMTTMYFPITFGGGDAAAIEPGKSYTVSLTFHGNFKPEDQGGGGGGGGTDDPETPVIPGDVDVTVTPAEWTPTATDKDFGKN